MLLGHPTDANAADRAALKEKPVIKDKVSELVSLCAFAGERFDLSQAGGGNASFINDGDLWITASGWPLSDVKNESAMCQLDHAGLVEAMRDLIRRRDKLDKSELERAASESVKQCVKTLGVRPSIETLMHCLLGPYTLHTHPIAVTALLCRKNWREAISGLFPDAILVGYETPGVRLALALAELLQSGKHASSSGVRKIFLENHGLIISGESEEEVAKATDEVVLTVANHLGLDLSRYKLSNNLTHLLRAVTDESLCSYYCEDKVLLDVLKKSEDLLMERPSWPDQLVYCGSAGVRLSSFGDKRALSDFKAKYGHLPKVVLVEDHLFLVDHTIKNCRRLEEVLKAHVMMLANADMDDVQFLSNDEQEYLLNWEAEKARQRM